MVKRENPFTIITKETSYAGNIYVLEFTMSPTEVEIAAAARSLDPRVDYFGYRVLARGSASYKRVCIKIHTD